MTILSCKKIGNAEPIILNKYVVEFGAEGGQEEIVSSNYKSFCIHQLSDEIVEKSTPSGDHLSISMDGIELLAEGNKLIIKVAPAEEYHWWKTSVWSFNAYSNYIHIYQNRPPAQP